MKRHLPFALKSILLVCFAGFLLAGCCSTHCVDCIPQAKMPYALYDGGVKYYLTHHDSIDQMIESQNEQDWIQKNWSETLRKKFPNDKELMTYLDLREERIKENTEKTKMTYWKYLYDIKANLEQSGGELYYYHSQAEEGWLILSKGKVFKKYVAATDIR
jgi:hypothetical protein